MKQKTAVLVTVFNRKDTTLRGLEKLKKAIDQMDKNEFLFDIFLVDDGSTDGTYECISTKFPNIHLYKGDGNLYYVRGMQLAWEKAVKTDDYDYYLWFNDDNELFENALVLLYESSEKNENSAICGAFCTHDGKKSYTGRDNKGNIIEPNGECQKISRMNGNLVLIPKKIFRVVGMMDTYLLHTVGDYDYGYRITSTGFSILLTPDYIGYNDHHDDELMNHLKELPFKKRWKMLHNQKHHPKYSFHFHKKHFGRVIALKDYINQYLFVLFPSYLDLLLHLRAKNIKWLKPLIG